MEILEKLPPCRLRVVLVFHGEPLEERSFGLSEPRGLSRRPTRITLGQQGHDTFAIPVCPLPASFPLLHAVGGDFVLRLSEGMAGKVHLSGETLSVRDLFASHRGIAKSPADAQGATGVREHVLRPKDWGLVATDASAAVSFFFEFLPPPGPVDLRQKMPAGPLSFLPWPIDPFLQKALLISGAVHGAVLLLALFAWEPSTTLSIDPPPTSRMAHILYQKRVEARNLLDAATASGKKEARDADALGWNGMAAMLAAQHDPRHARRQPLLSDDGGGGFVMGKTTKVPTGTEGAPVPVGKQQDVVPGATLPVPVRADKVPAATLPKAPLPAAVPGATLPVGADKEPAATLPKAPLPAVVPVSSQKAPLPAAAPVAQKEAPPKLAPARAHAGGPPGVAPKGPAPAARPPAPPARPGVAAPIDLKQPNWAGSVATAAPARPKSGRGPVVLSGAPLSQGPLSKGQVDKVITHHQDQVEACYRQELAHAPTLAGKLLLVWNVDASGSVTQARVEGSTIKNAALESCIVQRARAWRFPAARGMTQGASVPLVFRR